VVVGRRRPRTRVALILKAWTLAVDRSAIFQTLSPVRPHSGVRSLRMLSPRVSLAEFAIVLTMMSGATASTAVVVNSMGFH
jgi:hypothetical protein